MGQERFGPSLKRFGALALARVTGAEQTRSALYCSYSSVVPVVEIVLDRVKARTVRKVLAAELTAEPSHTHTQLKLRPV